MIKAYTCADTEHFSLFFKHALFHLWITNMKLASKMKTIKLRMLTLTWG